MALDRFGNFIDPEGDGGLFNTTQSDLINIIAPTPTPIAPTPTPTPTTTLNSVSNLTPQFTNQQIADYVSFF